MRVLAAWILALGVAAAPAMAAGTDKEAPASTAKSSAAARPAPASPAEARMENELQQMRDLLQAQSQQIQLQNEQLKQQQQQMQTLAEQLRATSAATANLAAAPVTPLVPAIGVVAANAPAQQDTAKRLDNLEGSLSDLARGKIKIGGTFFGDYAYYAKTGFGPPFLTQINQAGPGNDGFNSFDITRAYINLVYTPNDAVTFRLTPNIYRQVDVSGALGMGKNSAIASSSNGNLGFRLKYAYVDFNKLFSGSEAFRKDKLTVGQQQNPVTDWEETFWGYRYVSLVGWNYLSIASTYTGVALHGPIEFNGKEYLDYHVGVFDTASFHAIEQNDKKQVMARLTWYPFGTTSDQTGFGVTAFEDYGYSSKTPDTKSTPLNRLAARVHYQTHSKSFQITGEYVLGRNAFGTGNLFSGVGPADEFGLGPTPYATFDALAKALLGGDHTRQQGFDFFGHVRLGNSPFTLFGMYQYFQPNTKIGGTNPLDFQRIIGGISYKFNEHFQFALDSQNLKYTHSQFTMPASQIATFSPSLAAANPSGIPNVVPRDTNAIFLNLLFNY